MIELTLNCTTRYTKLSGNIRSCQIAFEIGVVNLFAGQSVMPDEIPITVLAEPSLVTILTPLLYGAI